MPFASSSYDWLELQRQPISFAHNRHTRVWHAGKSEGRRLRNSLELFAGIVVPPIPLELYPALLFVMQQDEVLGLVGVPISSTTVIERKGNISLVILSDK
jgi:hypothetical protein